MICEARAQAAAHGMPTHRHHTLAVARSTFMRTPARFAAARRACRSEDAPPSRGARARVRRLAAAGAARRPSAGVAGARKALAPPMRPRSSSAARIVFCGTRNVVKDTRDARTHTQAGTHTSFAAAAAHAAPHAAHALHDSGRLPRCGVVVLRSVRALRVAATTHHFGQRPPRRMECDG